MKIRREISQLAMVPLAALLIWACAEGGDPNAPAISPADQDGTFSRVGAGEPVLADSILIRICERDEGEIGRSKARIGPAGGTLERDDHQLIIPAGALNQQERITFTIPRTRYLECVLEPHGLEFNVPVSLILSYDEACGDDDDLDESSLTMAYFNPETEIWEPIPTSVDTILNIATGSLEDIVGFTDHFSRYGLIRR